jgi:hypothetical protein
LIGVSCPFVLAKQDESKLVGLSCDPIVTQALSPFRLQEFSIIVVLLNYHSIAFNYRLRQCARQRYYAARCKNNIAIREYYLAQCS